ncbi:hypothetical protein IscW_ISCW011068 [Ixodes scapularis]|uniref:Uncharacterized protein n=1 Tax=Ixodes scapularis TaxID=6945 RepID=B7Q410_IXOSC|nr:hypothetical protein IscW_ISCW011068 [Ixodes scapularis]|eukprot:XP_002411440.1 hypothetical protein IscW_ISCW011068 [Ixodes scapularis]
MENPTYAWSARQGCIGRRRWHSVSSASEATTRTNLVSPLASHAQPTGPRFQHNRRFWTSNASPNHGSLPRA